MKQNHDDKTFSRKGGHRPPLNRGWSWQLVARVAKQQGVMCYLEYTLLATGNELPVPPPKRVPWQKCSCSVRNRRIRLRIRSIGRDINSGPVTGIPYP